MKTRDMTMSIQYQDAGLSQLSTGDPIGEAVSCKSTITPLPSRLLLSFFFLLSFLFRHFLPLLFSPLGSNCLFILLFLYHYVRSLYGLIVFDSSIPSVGLCQVPRGHPMALASLGPCQTRWPDVDTASSPA